MRCITLLFFLTISIVLFSQTRKKLLKEINSYKYTTIKNTSFKTNKDSLNKVISAYFKKEEYLLQLKSDSILVFYINVICRGEKQFLDNNKQKRTRSSMYRNFFVEIKDSLYNEAYFLDIKSFFDESYPTKYEYNQAVLSSGTEAFVVNNIRTYCFYKGERGLFSFNSFDIRKYLYVHFYGNNISFSNELNDKITTYNLSQKKDKNRLVKGRDY